MAKFREDEGVVFVNLENTLSDWLNGRVCVVQQVFEQPGLMTAYHVIDSHGHELRGYEHELESLE